MFIIVYHYYDDVSFTSCFCEAWNRESKNVLGQMDNDTDTLTSPVLGFSLGYLVHKEYLPVLELHLGDTGTVTDNKVAQHKLGKLECTGDGECFVTLQGNTLKTNSSEGASHRRAQILQRVDLP